MIIILLSIENKILNLENLPIFKKNMEIIESSVNYVK